MKTILVKHGQSQEIIDDGDLKIVLQEGARVDHYILGNAKVDVKLNKDSYYQAFTFGSSDLDINLSESGAEAELFGLSIADQDQSLTNVVTIHHNAPHTLSNQKYKAVVDDQASVGFAGKIIITKKGDKSNANQVNKNLLLSKDARADSQPELEIDTDDVKVSHGSATGQLDEQALFYMQARGIPSEVARKLLLQGFCQEIIDEIPSEVIRQRIQTETEARLKTLWNLM